MLRDLEHGTVDPFLALGAGDGDRTRDSGEAHRRVTATLRLLGGVRRQTPRLRITVGREVQRPVTLRPALWSRTRTSRASAERATVYARAGLRASRAGFGGL